MPPRKSNVSTTSNGQEDGADATPAKSSKEGMSIEELTLPKSMIARLAKGVLPANTQIHKDALLALHKSATVFVSYIAANSSENAQASGKKTVMPPDVIAALKDAEFDGFLPRLEAELKKYNDVQCDKRNSYRRKVKEEKAAAAAAVGGEDQGLENGQDSEKASVTAELASTNGTTNGLVESDDMDRPVKKLKGDKGQAVAQDPGDIEDGDETFEQEHDEQDHDELEEDEGDEEVAGSDDEAADYDAGQDEQMEDALEEQEGRGELQDEALDEPDSD